LQKGADERDIPTMIVILTRRLIIPGYQSGPRYLTFAAMHQARS
jgi:hypothetical protein